jgi:hypothetical protein
VLNLFIKLKEKIMSEEIIEKEAPVEENEAPVEENEPIYYKPKSLNLVATVAGIVSWITLVGFVADVVLQVIGLQAQLAQQGLALDALLKEASFYAYLFTNMLIPLLTGLSLFLIMQGVSIGLNALLEIDFNAREPKN